jgi:hypothetical protein
VRPPGHPPLQPNRPGGVLTKQGTFSDVAAKHRRAPVTGLIGDDALGDTGCSSRGRKTGPQWFEPDTTLLVDSDRRLLRIVGSRPIDAPEQALSWWGRANPDAVYDSELFRREPSEARDRETLRDRRGNRLLEGARARNRRKLVRTC